MRAELDKAIKEKSKLHQDLDMQKAFCEKLKGELRAQQMEHAELKKNVNRVMLRKVVKDEEDDA